MPSVYIPRVSRDVYIRSVQCVYISYHLLTQEIIIGYIWLDWDDYVTVGRTWVRVVTGSGGGRRGVRSPSVWGEVVRFLSVSDLYEPS